MRRLGDTEGAERRELLRDQLGAAIGGIEIAGLIEALDLAQVLVALGAEIAANAIGLPAATRQIEAMARHWRRGSGPSSSGGALH